MKKLFYLTLLVCLISLSATPAFCLCKESTKEGNGQWFFYEDKDPGKVELVIEGTESVILDVPREVYDAMPRKPQGFGIVTSFAKEMAVKYDTFLWLGLVGWLVWVIRKNRP